jgi:hypothetical protein
MLGGAAKRRGSRVARDGVPARFSIGVFSAIHASRGKLAGITTGISGGIKLFLVSNWDWSNLKIAQRRIYVAYYFSHFAYGKISKQLRAKHRIDVE